VAIDKMCERKGCNNVAVYRPCLVLRPWADAAPAKAVLDLPLCDECMVQTRPSDLITDEGWQAIVSQFEAAGNAIPDRALTEVEWVDI